MGTADKVKSIIVEELAIKPEEVTENTNFVYDLGADSLDTVELIMTLEETFGIEMLDEDVEKLQTVGDIIKYIEEKLSKK